MDVENRAQDAFEEISLQQLRQRKSEKWTTYPADVLPAFVAEMDFMLAAPVRSALDRALDLGDCGYASVAELAPAFASFAAKRFDWTLGERSVFAVPDVMAGVTQSLRALTKPGAAVVINPPVYPPFFEVIRAAGRDLVEVPLLQSDEHGWTFDLDGLERAFAGGAQAFLLCNPHNPVGRAWTRSELERIAQLAEHYGVAVVSDEIHGPLIMPGIDHIPFLRVARPDQPCVALTSASKAWNIAGLKCALMVAGSEDARETVRAVLRENPTEVRWRVGHFGALANAAAFREGGPWLDGLRDHLDRNRKLLAVLLDEHIPGARYRLPEASYLAWIDCRQLGLGDDPAAQFLSRGRVALEAGHKFGVQGRGYARLNFGTSTGILTQIVQRMSAAI